MHGAGVADGDGVDGVDGADGIKAVLVHALADVEPTGAVNPAGQAVHDDALVPPIAERYVPAAHAVYDEEPAALHEPAGVAVHDSAPAALNVPAAHTPQSTDPLT